MGVASHTEENLRLELDSIAILMHVLTLTQTGQGEHVAVETVLKDLGFEAGKGESLMRELVHKDYLRYAGIGERVMLTPKGNDSVKGFAKP